MSVREKINDDEMYGVVWAELFISVIISGIIKVLLFPNVWMVALVPITWILVHLLIGNWLERNAKKDLFGKK